MFGSRVAKQQLARRIFYQKIQLLSYYIRGEDFLYLERGYKINSGINVWMATTSRRNTDSLGERLFVSRQGKGDQEIWYGPIANRYFLVHNEILSPRSVNGVLQQRGLSKEFQRSDRKVIFQGEEL
jgi:hypothetical protein